MTQDQGGPAFPQQCADALDVGMIHEGMTLRDYFAGQALANPAICTGNEPDYQLASWFGKWANHITRDQIIAKQAWHYADAMLAARAQPLPGSRP